MRQSLDDSGPRLVSRLPLSVHHSPSLYHPRLASMPNNQAYGKSTIGYIHATTTFQPRKLQSLDQSIRPVYAECYPSPGHRRSRPLHPQARCTTLPAMQSHQETDRRRSVPALAVAGKVDAYPSLSTTTEPLARCTCRRTTGAYADIENPTSQPEHILQADGKSSGPGGKYQHS